MLATNTKSKAFIIIFTVLTLVLASGSSPAQMLVGCDPFSSIIPGVETFRKTLEGDVPGLVNPRVPFLFLPSLRAEARVRALFIKLTGDLKDITSGESVDFVDDLGYEDQGIVIQPMLRLQLGRWSLKGQYDAYMRTYRGGGAGGRLEWPEFYWGVQFDLYNSSTLRLGLEMDFYQKRPTFSVVDSRLGSVNIVAPRPATWGAYLVWNPVNCGSLSGSFEIEARRSLRTGSKIDEIAVAAGFLSPQTVLGVVGLRGGWRYTDLELQQDIFEASAQWSAFFGELVYYY